MYTATFEKVAKTQKNINAANVLLIQNTIFVYNPFSFLLPFREITNFELLSTITFRIDKLCLWFYGVSGKHIGGNI